VRGKSQYYSPDLDGKSGTELRLNNNKEKGRRGLYKKRATIAGGRTGKGASRGASTSRKEVYGDGQIGDMGGSVVDLAKGREKLQEKEKGAYIPCGVDVGGGKEKELLGNSDDNIVVVVGRVSSRWAEKMEQVLFIQQTKKERRWAKRDRKTRC